MNQELAKTMIYGKSPDVQFALLADRGILGRLSNEASVYFWSLDSIRCVCSMR